MRQLPLIFEGSRASEQANPRKELPVLDSTHSQARSGGAVVLPFKPKSEAAETLSTQNSLEDLVDSVRLFM